MSRRGCEVGGAGPRRDRPGPGRPAPAADWGARLAEILGHELDVARGRSGAIGVECRADDAATRHFVEALNDPATWAAVRAERAMLWGLGGGCLVPIAALSTIEGNASLTLRGAVLWPDGSRKVVDTHRGPIEEPLNVGSERFAATCTAGAGVARIEWLSQAIGRRPTRASPQSHPDAACPREEAGVLPSWSSTGRLGLYPKVGSPLQPCREERDRQAASATAGGPTINGLNRRLDIAPLGWSMLLKALPDT